MDTSAMKNTENESHEEVEATTIELRPGYCALAIGPEGAEFAYDAMEGVGYYGFVLLGVLAAIETKNEAVLNSLASLGSAALQNAKASKKPRVAQLEE